MTKPDKQLLTIPRDKWEKLGDAERAIAEKLGIAPSDKGKRKSCTQVIVCVKQKQYTLGVIMDCKLCKEQTINIYNMIPEAKGDKYYLAARKTSEPEVFPDRWAVQKVPSCGRCVWKLKELSKKQLISMVIQLATLGRVVPEPENPKGLDNGNDSTK